MVQKEKIEDFVYKGKTYEIAALREGGGVRFAAFDGANRFPLTVCVSSMILEDVDALIRAGHHPANHPIPLAVSVVKSHVQASIDNGAWPA